LTALGEPQLATELQPGAIGVEALERLAGGRGNGLVERTEDRLLAGQHRTAERDLDLNGESIAVSRDHGRSYCISLRWLAFLGI